MPLNPNSQQSTKQQARRLTAEVIAMRDRVHKCIKRAWLDMAKKIQVCLDRKVPAALGLTAEQWWSKIFTEADKERLEDVGLSRAQIYRSLQIVKKLAKVPEAKIIEMGKEKASMLARLPESRMRDWVERACKESRSEFRDHVEQAVTAGEPLYKTEWRNLSYRIELENYNGFTEQLARVAAANSIDLETNPKLANQCFGIVNKLLADMTEEQLRDEQVEVAEAS